MLKVVIADDEKRICQLIRALVDWEALGMEVAGLAENGTEALRMVREFMPDILITDVRMPGCSGLELIENAKRLNPQLEIIIVSGYAHFEYAQTAIRFGVGDYLLKPIDKEELTATLEKLRKVISERISREGDILELETKSRKDLKQLRNEMMQRLFDGTGMHLSEEIMRNVYCCNRLTGDYYQICYIKIDGDFSEIGSAGLETLVGKVCLMAENALKRHCSDLFPTKLESGVVILMCSSSGRKDGLMRGIHDLLMQLEIQKNLFQPVKFTIAVGKTVSWAEEIGILMKESKAIIAERLYKGTGRILETAPEPTALFEKNLIGKYLRTIGGAVELLNIQRADEAVEEIRSGLADADRVTGEETYELVLSCGRMFLNRLELPDGNAQLERYIRECSLCGDVPGLLEKLAELQRSCLERLCADHDLESVRPIRQAKQYIQNHYSEPITMEEVSGHVGLSPTYFSTLFKKIEGEGFSRYLIGLRMEQAKALLRESNLPVVEICRKVGYNDIRHFTQSFEKISGVKPTTYRKLYG